METLIRDNMHVIAALIGSMLQEVFWWYERRWSESVKRNWGRYFVITTTFVLVSTIGTLVFLDGNGSSPKMYLIVGFGFPIVVKRAFHTYFTEQRRKKQLHAGPSDPHSFFRDFIG
jgi:hypothetical protein